MTCWKQGKTKRPLVFDRAETQRSGKHQKPAGPVGAEIHRIPHAKSEQKQFCETMFFRLEKHKKEFGNGQKTLWKWQAIITKSNSGT